MADGTYVQSTVQEVLAASQAITAKGPDGKAMASTIAKITDYKVADGFTGANKAAVLATLEKYNLITKVGSYVVSMGMPDRDRGCKLGLG